MLPLPNGPFDEWTVDDLEAAAEGEPVSVMPGSGGVVPGPRRELLEVMRQAGVRTAGGLDPIVRDRHRFSLLLSPFGNARRLRSVK